MSRQAIIITVPSKILLNYEALKNHGEYPNPYLFRFYLHVVSNILKQVALDIFTERFLFSGFLLTALYKSINVAAINYR